MGQRRYLREILDEASEAPRKGSPISRRAAQSTKRMHDQDRTMHHHDRASRFRCDNVYRQRYDAQSTTAPTSTTTLQTDNTIRTAEWHNTAASTTSKSADTSATHSNADASSITLHKWHWDTSEATTAKSCEYIQASERRINTYITPSTEHTAPKSCPFSSTRQILRSSHSDVG